MKSHKNNKAGRSKETAVPEWCEDALKRHLKESKVADPLAYADDLERWAGQLRGFTPKDIPAELVYVSVSPAQRAVILKFVEVHQPSARDLSEKQQVASGASTLLHIACTLPPRHIKNVIRVMWDYGEAEGFTQPHFLEDLAKASLARWSSDEGHSKP